MKITGAEFKEWHDTAWPDKHIWCDESTLDDGRNIYDGESGELIFSPEETFTIPGWWALQDEDHPMDGPYMSVRSLIKKWRRDRATIVLLVRIPKGAEGDARSLFADRGWSVT